MAKRFIDSELFCDEWFCDLSKDTKLFFIYFITRCDHAGVLKLNNKLCEFQTGIKSIQTVIEELGNSLVTVKNGVYFMPKYIKFQYPDFPKSSVKQQDGALKILISLGLWDEENNTFINSWQTVNKDLPKSYVNVNDIVIDNLNKTKKIKFSEYVSMTNEQYGKLVDKYGESSTKKFIEKLDNYKGSKGKKYSCDYRAILSWVIDEKSKSYQKSNGLNGATL